MRRTIRTLLAVLVALSFLAVAASTAGVVAADHSQGSPPEDPGGVDDGPRPDCIPPQNPGHGQPVCIPPDHANNNPNADR